MVTVTRQDAQSHPHKSRRQPAAGGSHLVTLQAPTCTARGPASGHHARASTDGIQPTPGRESPPWYQPKIQEGPKNAVVVLPEISFPTSVLKRCEARSHRRLQAKACCR